MITSGHLAAALVGVRSVNDVPVRLDLSGGFCPCLCFDHIAGQGGLICINRAGISEKFVVKKPAQEVSRAGWVGCKQLRVSGLAAVVDQRFAVVQ